MAPRSTGAASGSVQNGNPAVFSNSAVLIVGRSNSIPDNKHTEARTRRASVCLARPERFERPTAWFVALTMRCIY